MGTVEKINICHLVSGDLWAGAEVQLATLVSGLLEYKALNITAILYNSGILEERLRQLGVPVWVIDEENYNSLNLIRETNKILKEMECHILHSHRYKENVLGALARINTGVKCHVCTVHGLSEPFKGFKLYKAKIYEFCNYLAGRFSADRIIAVSDDTRKHLAKKYGSSKLITIHNGIDIDSLLDPQFRTMVSKKELGLGEDSFILGTIGRLMPVKGYEYLLKAFKLLQDKHDNLVLLIIGDGPERDALESLAQDLKISAKVVFYGFTENVSAMMGLFGIFILSSLSEGISLSLLEAMAAGIPAVVTSVGGNPEVISHNKTGLLVPPRNEYALAEACSILLTDQKFRSQLSLNGQHNVAQRFTKKAMAGMVSNLYRELIDSTR